MTDSATATGRTDVVAIILAGGRARRLGTPKPAVRLNGETLLDRALRATRGMAVVVVGPPGLASSVARHPAATVTREEPPFAGPAAAVAAGLDELALRKSRAGRVLVLACDLARVSDAAAALLTASDRNPDGEGVVLADPSGHRQWLCGIYGAEALQASVDRLRAAGALASAPARSLFDGMRLHEVPDPGGLSDDIDTPADLAAARERIRS